LAANDGRVDPAGLPPIVWAQSTHAPIPEPESRPARLRIRTTAVAALMLTLGYLVWRVTSTLHGASWWLAAPMLVLEVYSLVTLATHTVALWNLDAGPTPGTRRETDHRIAVLIPTYNEPYEILLPTVAAAVAMQLPHETWVLDDGDRPWVAEMATQLGARYTTREGSSHAKAGNINALLPQLDVDLIAVFDADHVARTDFLNETVGYFDDPKVALVQTPQDFYNIHSFEHVHRRGRRFGEQELFYRGLSAGRNRWNAAFWCGTNAVVRLEALRSVGGVAVETVTEDIHTTIRLHRRGWRTVYHNAVLARGLAASNSEQYLSQRLRWGTGAMHVLREENPATVSGLSMMQRVSYLSTLCGWFDSWRTLAYVMLPAVVLLTAGMPIAAPPLTFLTAFGVVFAAQQLALWALSRGHAPPLPATVFEFIRMPANLRATTALFSRRVRAFTVTAKGRQADGERSRMRAPRLLTALLIGNLVAGAWYVATILEWTPLTYPTPWVAHGAAFWLLVNIALLVRAVRRIRHERFGAERRAAVRFELPGVVFIDDEAVCPLRDVSLTGASVLAPDGLLHAGQRSHIHLEAAGILLGLDVLVRATVRVAEGDVAGLEFDRLDAHAHATLALALFATGVEPSLVEAKAAPVGSPLPHGGEQAMATGGPVN
jgi:cellulose synthase (UDP-forming)